MRAADILARGIDLRKNKDYTCSKTGKLDFEPEEPPEVKTFGPLEPKARPRTKASLSNSYT